MEIVGLVIIILSHSFEINVSNEYSHANAVLPEPAGPLHTMISKFLSYKLDL